MTDKKTQSGKGNAVKKFLTDVRFELSKVIWPGRPEVIASTIVVLVAVAFFSLFIGLLDQVFVFLIRLLG